MVAHRVPVTASPKMPLWKRHVNNFDTGHKNLIRAVLIHGKGRAAR